MADNQDTISTLIALRLDAAATQQTKQGINDIKTGIKDLSATAQQGSKVAETLSAKLATINRAAQVNNLGRDFGELATKIGSADKAADLLAGKLANIGASKEEIEAAAKSFSDFSSGGGEGGSASAQSLRRAGGALSQLGFGEAGRGVSIIGDIAQLGKFKDQIASLSPATIAAGVGVGALTVALDLYTKAQESARQAALADIDARQKALSLATTGTKDEIQARLNALEKEKEINQAAANDANQLFGNLREAVKTQLGGAALAAEDLAATTGKAAGAFQAAHDSVDTANTALNKTSTEMDILTKASGLTAQTTEEAAAAEEKLRYKRQETTDAIAGIENQLTAQKEAQQQIDSGSAEGLAKRKQDIYNELQLINKASEATAERLKLEADGSEAQAAYRAELKKLDGQFQSLSATYDALSTDLVNNAVAANDAAKANKEAALAQEAAGKVAAKYFDDVTAINQKFAEDQANIAQKLIDKQADIQNQAVEAAQKLLESLQQKQADLQRNLGREFSDQDTKAAQDRLQKQIDFQRQEVSAERKFQADIARIKEQAKEQEFELALDRDFAGLARSRRQTANQISDVTRQAQQERQDRLQAFRDQQDDAQRAFANERALKILQYQRSIADAQEAYVRDQHQLIINRNRALQAAQIAEQKELQVLNDKHQKELTAKYQAAQKEIELAQKSSDVRIQIMQREYTTALALFNAIGQGSSGGSTQNIPYAFANGGSLSAGGFGLVNERGSSGRESVTGGGRTYKLPGAGIFHAFNSSTINPNKGADNITVSNTFNITGGNPRDIGAEVDRRLEQSITRIFRQKATA